MSSSKTIVGKIDTEVLAFTVGRDPELDMALLDVDCIGTAAHVTMLDSLPLKPAIFGSGDRKAGVAALVDIMRLGRNGRFRITAGDQDVHLAVERMLTRKLGDAGKRVHTARSRNDQVAVDMRLYTKQELFGLFDEVIDLANALLSFARRHRMWPMVGRTHMQPAMPSSVGVWASAYAESLLDDALVLKNAYELNDRCPLGSAAGYGVPLAIDRKLASRLLGFSAPIHNVLHAGNSRGKIESVVLAALAQVMLTLSRLSEDMILYSMPEFGYFTLPPGMCTGSSIMPQKRNPDVLELVRAKTSRVLACGCAVTGIVNSLPGGSSAYAAGQVLNVADFRAGCPNWTGVTYEYDKWRHRYAMMDFCIETPKEAGVKGMYLPRGVMTWGRQWPLPISLEESWRRDVEDIERFRPNGVWWFGSGAVGEGGHVSVSKLREVGYEDGPAARRALLKATRDIVTC